MKKLILMFVMLLTVAMSYGQIVYQKATVFDNTYLGVQGGISSPLDFNHVTPFNGNASLIFGKNFTPVIGVELEGTAFFNGNHFNNASLVVPTIYVGLHPTINLTNLFLGYNPNKVFEVSTITGLGWIHDFPYRSNDWGAKTGLRFGWNVGNFNIGLTPSVYWRINDTFNKNHAQLAIQAGVVYKFKTSNGTHGFKKYDIGALNEEINTLRAAASKIPNEVIREKIVTQKEFVTDQYFIFFAQNSAELDDEAKNVLDNIPTGLIVDVKASASPEGTKEYNQKLSEKRAEVVANYLKNRNITVNSIEGLGCYGNTSNRVAAIIVNQ